MFVSQARSNDATVTTFEPATDFFGRIRRRFRREQIKRDFSRYLRSRPRGYEAFSDDRTLHGARLVAQIPPCDIINLHWVVAFLDYDAFFTHVPQSTPVVWTLHDMNAMTGGCHYDLGCGRYTTQCGSCPQLGSSDDQDLAFQVWQRKRTIFSHVAPRSLSIVTPSSWLAEEVKRSALLSKFCVDVIPNGIDVTEFAPRDRVAARDVLGIPQESKVVLFLADVLDNRRKGFDLLMQALPGCAKRVGDLLLMSVGRNAPPHNSSIPWLHLGFVADDRLLSLMYSAADLFVISSLQDNLPNTVLEALACGIPVVGFDVGGISDMVRPGITGLLALPFDVDSLRSAIVELLEDGARRREMATNCRRIAVEEYSLELQAKRYSELYKSLL